MPKLSVKPSKLLSHAQTVGEMNEILVYIAVNIRISRLDFISKNEKLFVYIACVIWFGIFQFCWYLEPFRRLWWINKKAKTNENYLYYSRLRKLHLNKTYRQKTYHLASHVAFSNGATVVIVKSNILLPILIRSTQCLYCIWFV